MGVEIAALMGFFGLTSAFALVATILAAWMAWRIVEKTGLPGWAGLGAILLTLTGVGTIVPLVLLWVFAFMRWPRDEPGRATPNTLIQAHRAGSVPEIQQLIGQFVADDLESILAGLPPQRCQRELPFNTWFRQFAAIMSGLE